MPLTPLLTAHWDEPDRHTLQGYRRHGGYTALAQALMMSPDSIIQVVKDSGLRGRGGAAFPTGMKWGFVPQGDDRPHYLVVNADESEPGACKDIPLMMTDPHSLVEGVIITSFAIRAHHAFIYVRGEVPFVVRRVREAVAQAAAAGLIGQNILGSGFDLDVVVHAGAGAYICGEETALLNSLEGLRGQPRLKPPFPAVAGLYAAPTVVNNVETIAYVPTIIERGASWFASFGTEKSPGIKLFAMSGHVGRPGIYEAPMGISFRELLDYAGGMRAGHQLKFWLPGGSSVPLLTDDHVDIPMTYEDIAAAGSMFGTGTPMVFDETTSVVRAVSRWIEFYKHESCGKCTPCREGNWWLVQMLTKFEAGKAREGDIEKMLDLCDNMGGKSFCALADGAVACVTSAVKHFRSEFEAGYKTPAWDLLP